MSGARLMVARLLVVLSGALCLWVVTPGTASASGCGGSGFRADRASAPFDGPRKCNGYAGNGARVLGATAVAVAIGLAFRAYRRGARATRTAAGPDPATYSSAAYPSAYPSAYPAAGPTPDTSAPALDAAQQRSKLERFAASALAGALGAQPWTSAMLRVVPLGAATETTAEVHRPDGTVEAIATPGEAVSTLLELREAMSTAGPGAWLSAALTLTRTPDGQVDFTVHYDYPTL